MRSAILLSAFMAASFLAACGPSIEQGSGGTTSGGLPPCEEMEMPPGILGQKGSATPFQCTLPSPCPVAELTGNEFPDNLPPNMGSFTDPAAVTCVLSALRDRTVSQVSFSVTTGMGDYVYTETVFIVDATRGVSNWDYVQDLGHTFGVRNRQIIKPPSYFDGCMQLTDPVQQYDCMSRWSDGCSDTAALCPAP
jgi:hypothetical protein